MLQPSHPFATDNCMRTTFAASPMHASAVGSSIWMYFAELWSRWAGDVHLPLSRASVTCAAECSQRNGTCGQARWHGCGHRLCSTGRPPGLGQGNVQSSLQSMSWWKYSVLFLSSCTGHRSRCNKLAKCLPALLAGIHMHWSWCM